MGPSELELPGQFPRRDFLAGGSVALSVMVGNGTATSDEPQAQATAQRAPVPPEFLRVAACQLLTGTDLTANTERILGYIDQAAGQGVDVLLFPEACLCGYVSDKAHYEALGAKAIAAAEARVIAAVAGRQIAVVLGSVHWDQGELFNSLLVIDRGGVVRGRYAKTFLAESWPENGRTLPVFEVAGVPSCFIICHDVRYPELVRLPAMAGAQICYFSSHESGLKLRHKLSAYRAMPISRATENGIFLVMANASANPQDLSGSHGNSKVVHPDGNVLQEADHFTEGLVTQQIRLADANRSIAQRCERDPTLLRDWFRQGVCLVSRG